MGGVTRREWRWATVFAVAVMALTVVPYAIGYANQTEQQRYTGFVLGVDDGVSYLAKLRYGLAGHWRFSLIYTSEPHDPAPLTYWSYLVPGQAARLFTDVRQPDLYTTLALYFHAMRLLFGGLLILMLYRFVALFVAGLQSRLFALALMTLGGGLGWLLLVMGGTPPEWYIPEGFTFMLLLTLPHLALARLALVGGFWALFASASDRRYALLAGLLWLVTTLWVPFYLAVVYAVLGVWGLLLWVRRRAFPLDAFIRAVMAAGVPLPLFLFLFWQFQVNPAMAQWSAQNSLPAPPPLHYLLAYAPFLIGGAFGVRGAWRSEDERWLLVLAWALAGLTLVYLPVNVQRRLAEGVLIPLALLATVGAMRFAGWGRAALLVIAGLSSVLLLAGLTLQTASQSPTLYTDATTIDALLWLDANASEPGAVVLSRKPIGNRVPAYTALRPYVGHGPETLFSSEKEPAAEAFFNGELPPAEAQALVTGSGIDYIFTVPGDRLPDSIEPITDEIYSAGGVTVYAVTP